MIKCKLIFKQLPYKICLSNTPTAIDSHQLCLLLPVDTQQLSDFLFSSNNLTHIHQSFDFLGKITKKTRIFQIIFTLFTHKVLKNLFHG